MRLEAMDATMESETRYHSLTDGRRLAYCVYGDPQGIPIFYAHGGPGSRLEGRLFDEGARRHGFRLIATDRPGMGQSTFKPGRKLLEYPADICELAEALGIDQFGVMGWSGVGAHTMVCGYADRKIAAQGLQLRRNCEYIIHNGKHGTQPRTAHLCNPRSEGKTRAKFADKQR